MIYLLEDDEKIRSVLRNELLEIKEKYSDERKTEIVESHDDIDLEDLIERHKCVITMTRTGYVKRQRVDAFRAMGKGAQGHKGLSMKDEDVTEKVIVVDSHSILLLFTNMGKIFAKKA